MLENSGSYRWPRNLCYICVHAQEIEVESGARQVESKHGSGERRFGHFLFGLSPSQKRRYLHISACMVWPGTSEQET